jgi:hypothetical protein
MLTPELKSLLESLGDSGTQFRPREMAPAQGHTASAISIFATPAEATALRNELLALSNELERLGDTAFPPGFFQSNRPPIGFHIYSGPGVQCPNCLRGLVCDLCKVAV